MELILENHSMYPRVGDTDHDLRLRRAHHEFDRGDIDFSDLKAIENNYVEEIIGEQIEAGLDILTDGMIRWYDHISHLARGIVGAEVSGLVRYFDTNYLVREARVTERIEWRDPLTVNEFEFASSVSDKPVKAVLTGPLTMAEHSVIDDGPYDSREDLVNDYTSVLREEVRALKDAGVEYLQIEEPSLLQNPEDGDWIIGCLNRILENTNGIETRLATYFGDAAPLYDLLQNVQADVLIFDFTYSDELETIIAEQGSQEKIGFGLLNGRNTKLSDPEDLAGSISAMGKNLVDGPHVLTFSCGLDYLPRDRARRKLDHLARVRDALKNGSE